MWIVLLPVAIVLGLIVLRDKRRAKAEKRSYPKLCK